MRRIASHYVYYRQLFRLSYIELGDDGQFVGIYPLNEEIAGTEFQDGILVPVACNNEKLLSEGFSISPGRISDLSRKEVLSEILGQACLSDGIEPGTPVRLFLLNSSSLTATELRTNHSCGNSHVERL